MAVASRFIARFIARLAQTDFARKALEEEADLGSLKQRPGPRVIFGLCVMAFSYVIGWPVVGALGVLSVYFSEPLLVVAGGPAAYGLSHLVFLAGLYLAGAEYGKTFLKWATRAAILKWSGGPPDV
jgi:hypothetical protein